MAFERTASRSARPRISSAALATSALMHALIALAFLSALPQHQIRAPPAAVEITVDMAAAQPAEAAARAQPSGAGRSAGEQSQLALEVPDPPPLATETPVEFAPSPPEAAAPEIATRTSAPQPREPAPPGRQRQAAVAPQAPPRLALEKMLPPIAAPPAPSASDFAGESPRRTVPPPAAKASTPRAPTPGRALPSEAMRAATRAAPSPAAATRAADDGRQRQARQDYLWQIIRKLSRYKVQAASPAAREQGLVVLRLTVARDGRLLDLALAGSSGSPDLDRGVMEAARKASPFAPLPAEIAAVPYTLTVPIGYVHDR